MSKSISEQIEDLRSAIAAQEMLRPTLGDAVVDTTLAVLIQNLTALENEQVKSEAHRKLVTILFADVSGFTALSETLDAEEVHDLMNVLWERVDTLIVQRGGYIDKHMGDAVMAIWGVGATREDDAEQCVRTGLELQTELHSLTVDWPHRVQMRVGVHTGPVLLGRVGSTGEFTATGDAVNLTSRLQNAAPVGGVIISHDTYRQVSGIFDVQPQPPVTLKGKREPVQTYIVQRARARTFHMSTRGVEGIQTPMIGRSAELSRLQAAFETTPGQPHACLVNIVGEAGLGKSRLLMEFESWLETRPGPIHVFQGRATPGMLSLPYGIVRNLFSNRFDILESDHAATVRAKFEAGLAVSQLPDQIALAGQLVGFDFSTTGAVQNLLGSPMFARLAQACLVSYFRSLAVSGPLVIFMEDIHWADSSSLDFLETLTAGLPGQSIMIVCTSRPILFERRGDWGNQAGALRIELQPLSPEMSRCLVNEILHKLQNLPGVLRELIVQNADGNPFYVEELIKNFMDCGVILRGDDHWQVQTEKLQQVRVPATLMELLQARLDGLPQAERSLLQRASVVGQTFWDATLMEMQVPGETAPQIAPLLQKLQWRELIFQQRRSTFAGLQENTFKHSMLREATYETVLLKLRRIYHRQAADWLLERCGDRQPEYLGEIGNHFERAGDAEQAVLFYQQQARDANTRSAYRDAVRILERAIQLTRPENAVQLAQLHLQMSHNLEKIGEYDASIEHLDRCLDLARTTGSPGIEAEALCILAWVMDLRGQKGAAEQYSRKALELAQQAGDLRIMIRALTRVAGLYDARDPEKALEIYQQALDHARQGRHTGLIATTLLNIGNVELNRGNLEAAEGHYQASQHLSESLGNSWGVENCINNRAILCKLRHEFEQGLDLARQALQMAEEIGDLEGQALCLFSLAHCRGGLKQIPEARADLRRAWEIVQKTGLELSLDLLNIICRLLAAGGRDREAAEVAGLIRTEADLVLEIAQDVEDALGAVALRLSPAELDAALARGASLDRGIIIRRFLEESGQTE